MSNKSVMLFNNSMAVCMAACLFLAPLGASAAGDSPQAATGPTEESVIAAEHAYAKAFVDGDADALGRILADDWEVVSGFGEWSSDKGTQKDIVGAVRSRYWVHSALDVSDIKVRLYGNVAVVTEHLTTSGVLGKKVFNDVKETESDTFVWSDGTWKCVLTHETVIRKS